VLARISIQSLAVGGDGVGRAEGLAVFVSRTAPGDVVDVELEPHGRFARGRLLALHERSALRVDPPCVHYTRDRCGGCQLQHISEPAQRDAKQGIVRDALTRIGKVTTNVQPVYAAPSAWRYRNSLTLALRRDGTGGRIAWRFGLRDFEDPEIVFNLEDCLITDQRVLAVWGEVRDAAEALPNADRMRATVRWLGERASFAVTGGADWPAANVQAFARACPSIAVAHWTPEGAPRRVVFDTRPQPAPPALSFTQVNPAVAAELHADVVRHALAHAPRTAIDAYSGIGETAQALASAGVVVTAIEVDREAAAWAAARLTSPSRSVARRVEQVLHRVLPADVVILNPPRAGLDVAVARALENCTPAPRAIVYVSCDPATLARDVRRMGRYTVTRVQPYDMFPQTAHVETLCELVPRV
jgi:23S rRNA (uracil1939-C5)-methyltransferase